VAIKQWSAKTWVRAALLAAALGTAAVMQPVDWCTFVGVCESWFWFLCERCG
jgi:hypothetical protein